MEALQLTNEILYRPVTRHKELLGWAINLDMREIRLVDIVLGIERQQANPIQNATYTIRVEEYAKGSNISIEQAYKDLKEIVKNVFDSAIIAERGKIVEVTRLITSVKYNDTTASLEFKWNKDIVNYLYGNHIPGTFYTIDSRMCLTSSNTRYCFAELLQSNLHKNRFSLSLENVKKFLNIDKKYDDYRNFRRKVLEPTLKDLQHFTGWKVECKGNRLGTKNIMVLDFEVKGRLMPKISWVHYEKGENLQKYISKDKDIGEFIVTDYFEDGRNNG